MALKFGIIGKFKNLFAYYYESVMSQSAEQSPTLPLRKAELLCPAGTFRNMQYAFAYGADAV